jgi:dipeptidyl aminopeptidase/acylaminoacyl peptidase
LSKVKRKSRDSATVPAALARLIASDPVKPSMRVVNMGESGYVITQSLIRSRPDLPSEQLAPMKPVTYKARDGMTIHAYLITPKGEPVSCNMISPTAFSI